MRVLQAGHHYTVDYYDYKEGDIKGQCIFFMKRIGEGYPGNTGHPESGTNCQELIRVLINRVEYLNNQIYHENNVKIIDKLRDCIFLFEERAAERHNIKLDPLCTSMIEHLITCSICGHIKCKHIEERV